MLDRSHSSLTVELQMLRYGIFGLSLVLAACGGGRNPDAELRERLDDRIGSEKVQTLGDADLAFDNGTVEGTGVVRFATPLSEPKSANNFVLRFTLADGGSVKLIANASRDLYSGIEIQFLRQRSGLNVYATAGLKPIDISRSFANLDATGGIAIAIDLHNDHGSDVHAIFWNEVTGAELLEGSIQGSGAGANWGLSLKNAKITHIGQHKPRHEH